jgi:4-hydroxybenzoate polyprenyltransferase
MKTLYQNIGGFISASRVPNLIIIAFTQVATGLILLGIDWNLLLQPSFFGLIFSTQMIAAAGYIINDYYDQKIDMVNRPTRVIVGVKLRRRFALLGHTLLNFVAIFIGFWIDPLVGMIHFFSAFVLWYYSNRLRRLPLIGNLAIATLSGLTFLIVAVYFRQQSNLVMIYALFAFSITLIREIIKDIEDVKGEAAFGCETIPVVWGIQGAKIAIYLTAIGGSILLLIFLWVMSRGPLLIYFGCLTPAFLGFLWYLRKADTQEQFSNLHSMCNFMILSGLISILFLV